MDRVSFADMERWDLNQLRKFRVDLREKLTEEIQKRNTIKAEIVFLQKEIQRYESDI